VSDDQQWQAPGSQVPPPPPGWTSPGPNTTGPTGQPVGGYPPPPQPGPYGYAAPPPGAGPVWTPPPKPGLIPLRPLSLGTVLGASFQVLRRNPKPTFGVALLIQGIVTIVSIVVVGVVAVFAFGRVASATTEDQEALFAGATATVLLSAIIPLLLSLIAVALLQGIIVLEVARGTLGEKLRLAGLWRLARGRIWALVGWVMAVTGIVVVGIAILAGIVVLIVATGGQTGIVVGVLLGILALLAVVALAVWLGTKLSMVPSAIMLERLPIGAAVRRSWSLTNGFFWRTFGIQFLVSVILNVAAQVITTPFSLIFGLAGGIFAPTGDQTAALATMGVSYVLLLMVSAIISAIASVVQSATTALLYIDLRMRKEGLDLQLQRFVEERAGGVAGIENPYLVGTPGARLQAAPTGESPWA
jgi:hypothetical protein